MYVFAVGMERCGTHSIANIVKNACKVSNYVVHEDVPFLCREAKLLFDGKDFRTRDLKKKVNFLRRKHKQCELVCEANHRLGYFITLLMREFAPDCKFVFSVREPVSTIISRMCIWSYYPNFIDKYPDFYKQKISELKPPHDFNDFRITPPKSFEDKSLIDLYLWEWIENYKFVRRELACIPRQNRFIVFTEDITAQFDRILGFIGMDNFKIDDEVMGWARVKSDSVYIQPKEKETDVFITRNRDPNCDETVKFAKEEVGKCKNLIASKITSEFAKLPSDSDHDLVNMDRRIVNSFKPKIML